MVILYDKHLKVKFNHFQKKEICQMIQVQITWFEASAIQQCINHTLIQLLKSAKSPYIPLTTVSKTTFEMMAIVQNVCELNRHRHYLHSFFECTWRNIWQDFQFNFFLQTGHFC